MSPFSLCLHLLHSHFQGPDKDQAKRPLGQSAPIAILSGVALSVVLQMVRQKIRPLAVQVCTFEGIGSNRELLTWQNFVDISPVLGTDTKSG